MLVEKIMTMGITEIDNRNRICYRSHKKILHRRITRKKSNLYFVFVQLVSKTRNFYYSKDVTEKSSVFFSCFICTFSFSKDFSLDYY